MKNRLILSLVLVTLNQSLFADLLDSYHTGPTPTESPLKTKGQVQKKDAVHQSDRKTSKSHETKQEPKSRSRKSDSRQTHKPKGDKKKAPVRFEGLGGTGLKSEGLIELHKNVVVTQEDLRLEADEAKIFMEPDSDEVKNVFAEGNVKISKLDEASGKLVKAFGKAADFDNQTQLITLRGNARVEKGEDILTGNIIYYNVKTGWVKVEKVKGVVNP